MIMGFPIFGYWMKNFYLWWMEAEERESGLMVLGFGCWKVSYILSACACACIFIDLRISAALVDWKSVHLRLRRSVLCMFDLLWEVSLG